ncbi:GAF domain-containing protein [Lentilactobacillus farraginis]|uniref:GAF domain-containing protein n=1 Tax=Lentilactobacillus farraginis DSM 18382 = JCM 14108 TaxID=1423743 RepID=X0PF94_9LACO|nr:GAF domain-containing protein [Lentilactobacillus farraginis]GAF35487.1 hypothetical protein JCM14108_375 [Lentilactobacillus farraginis DSM 18382 = JCM 14108]
MTLSESSSVNHYNELVNQVYRNELFELVAVALQSQTAARQIKWRYAAGNQNEKFRKIVLRSGMGIAGLVIRTGKPFWCDRLNVYQLRDAMYTPIAKCESLTGAAAVPIMSPATRLVDGVLLAGFRNGQPVSNKTVQALSQYLLP